MAETQPDAIVVCGLHHAYKGHRALDGASFVVECGTIHGFVGPNGAGKTTTLKVIATLMKPQHGSVTVLGYPVKSARKQVRRRIGYMPDHFSSYRLMTVHEYLDFFAAAYGLGLAARNRTIADVLALTDMTGRKDDLVQSLSRGMQQRVALARVLVHDPELLLLDEPASGLDPRARIELMEILKELCRLGKTIFISSHILSELADLCDSCTILDRGKVLYSGAMRELLVTRGAAAQYKLRLEAATDGLREALLALDGVSEITLEQEGTALRIDIDPSLTSANALLQTALQSGARIVAFEEGARELDQVFMELTEPGVRP